MNRVEKTQNCWGDCWFELFLLINAQDNLPPFPEIFFVQILRIIVWSFRTAELDVPNTDRNTEFFFERTQMRWAALQPTVLLWSFYALVDILSANQECRLLRPIFGVVCRFAGGFPHCLLPLPPAPPPRPLPPHRFLFHPRFSFRAAESTNHQIKNTKTRPATQRLGRKWGKLRKHASSFPLRVSGSRGLHLLCTAPGLYTG